MTRTIRKDDEVGVRIARVGPGVYEVQFREYTKSGKPKWISNALTRVGDLDQAKEIYNEMRDRIRERKSYSTPIGQ